MMKGALILAALVSAPAFAQVSLEELDAAAQETDATMTAFRDRLNDPDPDKALAVLELMIRKGDVSQKRLAVRHGLESTDRAIRATALRAIFDSLPTLRIVLNPVSDEANSSFNNEIARWGGVLDEDGNGSVTFKINGYDAGKACWTITRYKSCLVMMRADAVSVWFGDSWGNYELDGNTGRLLGEQMVKNSLASGMIDLSE